MQFPTIHMNGSSKQDLVDQWAAVYSTIGDAIEAVCSAAPNDRDYYVQGDTAYSAARKEHDARLKVLQDTRDEFMALCDHADKE